MIRYVIAVASLVLFALTSLTFAQVQTPAVKTRTKVEAVKMLPVKATVLHMTGKVREMTDMMIKIDRTVKDKVETVEFALEKPAKVKVGDKVRIGYVEKNGHNVVVKVSRVIKKKVLPKVVTPSELPIVQPEAPPPVR